MTDILNLKQQLVNEKGEPDTYDSIETKKKKIGKKFEQVQEKVKRPVLTGDIVKNALLTKQFVFGPKKQGQRYDLFKKIQGAEYAEFTRKEAKLIREVVGRGFGVLVYGQIKDWLETKTKEFIVD